MLSAAVDADLVEHRLEVVLNGVWRDEEPLRDRTGIGSRDERRGHVTFSVRERIARQRSSNVSLAVADRSVTAISPSPSPSRAAASIITHRPSTARNSACAPEVAAGVGAQAARG